MIEVQIPKDIEQYQATLVGPFTTRQVICIAVAAVCEFIYYTIIQATGAALATDTLIGIGSVIAIPFLLFAIWKPYGMKPETYIWYFLIPYLIGNKDRPYAIENTFSLLFPQEEETADKNTKKKQTAKPGRRADILYR